MKETDLLEQFIIRMIVFKVFKGENNLQEIDQKIG